MARRHQSRDRALAEAVATVWAEIDGRAEQYRRERYARPGDKWNTGTFSGYTDEAQLFIARLRESGLDIVQRG